MKTVPFSQQLFQRIGSRIESAPHKTVNESDNEDMHIYIYIYIYIYINFLNNLDLKTPAGQFINHQML